MLPCSDVTAVIAVERISGREVRVTVTADIRVSGDLTSLLSPQGASAGAAGGSAAVVSEPTNNRLGGYSVGAYHDAGCLDVGILRAAAGSS